MVDDRLVRRMYRVRSWLLCHAGRHRWAQRRNPDVGGRGALFDECRRCGTIRMGWDECGHGPVN